MIEEPLFADDLFRQPVAKGGYRIVRAKCQPITGGKAVTDWIVTDLRPMGTFGEWVAINPARYGRLVQETASIEGRDEMTGIVGFANAFGLLGVRPVKAQLPDGRVVIGELVSDWERAIGDVRGVLDLWRLVQSRSLRALRKVIVKRPITRSIPEPYWHCALGHPWPIMPISQGDVLKAARLALVTLVKDHQKGNVTTTITGTGKRLQLRIVPATLIGVVWLTLARGIARAVRFQECKLCGAWITLSTRDAGRDRATRDDTKYCSRSCRQKAYRARSKRKGKRR